MSSINVLMGDNIDISDVYSLVDDLWEDMSIWMLIDELVGLCNEQDFAYYRFIILLNLQK